MSLPTEDKARKALPLFTGELMYFPLASLAVAEVSRVGNDQHNPGEPLHWAREKSTNQMDTAMRHQMDHGMGNQKDTDGTWHLAKAIWRLKAELQLAMEAAQARGDNLFTGKAITAREKGMAGFAIGQRVRHPEYGIGTALRIWGSNDHAVDVEFDTHKDGGTGKDGSFSCFMSSLVPV